MAISIAEAVTLRDRHIVLRRDSEQSAPKPFPSVAIVVLNWNGKVDTIECLKSLHGVQYPRFEVIVVDNASTDGSVQAISEAFPSLTLIPVAKNLGYAGGNNAGIRHALQKGADYVLLLNNDTTVDPLFLSIMVDTAEGNPDVAMLGAKILFANSDNRIWFIGATWNREACRGHHRAIGEVDEPPHTGIVETDYVTGCALLIRSATIRRIGLMEEEFFLYYEEADWCFHARRQGFRCLVALDALVWHKASSSTGGRDSPLTLYFMERNRLLWAERNLPVFQLARTGWMAVTSLLRGAFQGFHWPGTVAPRPLFWHLREYFLSCRMRIAAPRYRARVIGVRDYFFRRFGDCPAEIRRLSSEASAVDHRQESSLAQ
jgi:GT2 family glycosyltransferase